MDGLTISDRHGSRQDSKVQNAQKSPHDDRQRFILAGCQRQRRRGGSGEHAWSKPKVRDRLMDSPLWATLSPRAKSVFFRLWKYGGRAELDNAGSGVVFCFPKRDTIAKAEGCSVDTIDRAMRELRLAGLLEWAQTGRANAYALFIPAELIDERLAEAESEPAPVPHQAVQSCGDSDRNGADADAAKLQTPKNPVREHPAENTHHQPPATPSAGGGGGSHPLVEGEEAEANRRVLSGIVGNARMLEDIATTTDHDTVLAMVHYAKANDLHERGWVASVLHPGGKNYGCIPPGLTHELAKLRKAREYLATVPDDIRAEAEKSLCWMVDRRTSEAKKITSLASACLSIANHRAEKIKQQAEEAERRKRHIRATDDFLAGCNDSDREALARAFEVPIDNLREFLIDHPQKSGHASSIMRQRYGDRNRAAQASAPAPATTNTEKIEKPTATPRVIDRDKVLAALEAAAKG